MRVPSAGRSRVLCKKNNARNKCSKLAECYIKALGETGVVGCDSGSDSGSDSDSDEGGNTNQYFSTGHVVLTENNAQDTNTVAYWTQFFSDELGAELAASAIWYTKEGNDGQGVTDGGFPSNREDVTPVTMNENAEFMAFSTSARAFSIGYPGTVFIFNSLEGWINGSFILETDTTVSGSQIAVPNEGHIMGIDWVGHTTEALIRIIAFWNGGA